MPLDLARNTELPSLGVHLFKVIRTSEEVGSAGPYYRLICRIEDSSPDRGKECMLQLSLAPTVRWKVEAFLDALNAPKRGSWEHSDFMGKLFRSKITYDESSGKTRVNFATFMPYEGSLPAESETTPPPPGNPAGGLPSEFAGEEETPF